MLAVLTGDSFSLPQLSWLSVPITALSGSDLDEGDVATSGAVLLGSPNTSLVVPRVLSSVLIQPANWGDAGPV